jgi:hypothetical protein
MFNYITALPISMHILLQKYQKKQAFTTRFQPPQSLTTCQKPSTSSPSLHDVRPELGGWRALQYTRGFRRAALQRRHVRQHRYDAWKCTHTATGPLTHWRLIVSACTVRFNTKRLWATASQCIQLSPHNYYKQQPLFSNTAFRDWCF